MNNLLLWVSLSWVGIVLGAVSNMGKVQNPTKWCITKYRSWTLFCDDFLVAGDDSFSKPSAETNACNECTRCRRHDHIG